MRPQGAANAGLLREPSDSDGQVSLIVEAIKLLNEHLLNHYGRRFNYGLGMTKKIDSRTATPRLFVKLPFKGSAENYFQCSSLLSSPLLNEQELGRLSLESCRCIQWQGGWRKC